MDEYLHARRLFELRGALASFPLRVVGQPPVRVLEIGAGTGGQAAVLDQLGYDVTAVDVPGSAYATDRVYPVLDYDDAVLPAGDASIDVVFSSNVMEHVPDVVALLRETRRVLAPGGVVVHVLPTASWRLWSTLVHPLWVLKRAAQLLNGRALRAHGTDGRDQRIARRSAWWSLLPRRHGERGNLLTEIHYFSVRWWTSTFRMAGFRVEESRPAGLFYTGAKILGPGVSIEARSRLARVLGSSCWIYVLSDPSATHDMDLGQSRGRQLQE